MSNAIFPALPGLSWDVKKTPSWNTRVQRSTGGMELRATYYSLPIWSWTLSYDVLRAIAIGGTTYTEMQALADFYNARQGMYDSFLYDDPTDDTIADTARQQFGTGDGTTTAFQLTRTLYASGVFTEPVYNLNGNPKIYVAGVLKTSGTDYTISAGKVTFAVAPAAAAALTWSGSWYWRVRFDQDSAEFNNQLFGLWDLKQIKFVSVKGS